MNENQYFMVHVTGSRVVVDDLLVSTTETLSALMFHLLVLMCPAPNFAGGFSTSCAARLMLILPVEATFKEGVRKHYFSQKTDFTHTFLAHTPWKLNMAPENKPSQKESNLPTIVFQGRTVKLRGCIMYSMYSDVLSYT